MKKNINNFVIIIIITILILLSRFRYLLFHTIVELLSISLGFSMLLFAITKLKLEEISKFEILSFSYGIIAIIDLFHTLAYKGMGVFHNISANEPTQLWISARILESITLFLYAVSFGINNYYKEKISKNIKSLFSLFLIILLIYLFFTFISIFILKIFPVCFIEERGLTAFKKITEYIIVFILFISLLMSSNSKDNFFRYYRLAIIFSIFSELSFTVYKDVYDLFNMTGHIFKYLSFIFVYRYTMANIIELPYLKLKELNALLESENQELILARKKAEEANRAKSAFIANINHEINTPLNAILIYANILYNQESNPDNRELINHIIDGGSNLYKIFENLILISQIEIDEFKIEYNESNLKDFIYTIISTYKYIEDKKEL
ncbi:MAG: MASE3 domain-containing protein, partial [Exilispira sp.]